MGLDRIFAKRACFARARTAPQAAPAECGTALEVARGPATRGRGYKSWRLDLHFRVAGRAPGRLADLHPLAQVVVNPDGRDAGPGSFLPQGFAGDLAQLRHETVHAPHQRGAARAHLQIDVPLPVVMPLLGRPQGGGRCQQDCPAHAAEREVPVHPPAHEERSGHVAAHFVGPRSTGQPRRGDRVPPHVADCVVGRPFLATAVNIWARIVPRLRLGTHCLAGSAGACEAEPRVTSCREAYILGWSVSRAPCCLAADTHLTAKVPFLRTRAQLRRPHRAGSATKMAHQESKPPCTAISFSR